MVSFRVQDDINICIIRLCVIGVAAGHPCVSKEIQKVCSMMLAQVAQVNQVDFDVGKQNRLTTKVRGKKKKGGSLRP